MTYNSYKTKRLRPAPLSQEDRDDDFSSHDNQLRPHGYKRARRASDEEWAPQAFDTNPSVTNAPAKAEPPSDSEQWETLETRTVAVDCSHVNLRAH